MKFLLFFYCFIPLYGDGDLLRLRYILPAAAIGTCRCDCASQECRSRAPQMRFYQIAPVNVEGAGGRKEEEATRTR